MDDEQAINAIQILYKLYAEQNDVNINVNVKKSVPIV